MAATEYRIFGPPGTGKTWQLAKWIRQSAERHGAKNVIVTSFTKAAAEVIAGREIEGVAAATLHAHCYRALDRPDIAESFVASERKGITPWNSIYPHMSLSGKTVDVDTDIGEPGDGAGDAAMAEMQRLRGMMVPRNHWSDATVIRFADTWDDWKQQHNLFDFTDLIERALTDTFYAPGTPLIMFVDEAQDMTPLQMALVRHWAKYMDTLVFAGDDDQILYAWAGASPDTMLNPPIPDEQLRVLGQSYRMPRAIWERSERWVRQIAVRQPKTYAPRDEDGTVYRSPATWRRPEAMMRHIIERSESGESVMILGSCGYMLDPLLKLLRNEGIPFHNPYRMKAGNWNPLGGHGVGRVSATQRLLSFLRPDPAVWGEHARMWTYRDLHTWASVLRVEGVLVRGAKTEIEAKDTRDEIVPIEQLQAWFTEDAMNHIWDGDIDWYANNLMANRERSMQFPVKVAHRYGAERLRSVPLVTVGTIHSVKGGESDTVFLYPDLSQQGYWGGWMASQSARDNVRRLAYVGMTRAAKTLVLCNPASELAWTGM